jgi:hypothetical protein
MDVDMLRIRNTVTIPEDLLSDAFKSQGQLNAVPQRNSEFIGSSALDMWQKACPLSSIKRSYRQRSYAYDDFSGRNGASKDM